MQIINYVVCVEIFKSFKIFIIDENISSLIRSIGSKLQLGGGNPET